MKKVIIIGENSYIGKSFAEFAKDRYKIKIISSRNNAWKNENFAGYDSILYCAGIAHTSRDPKMKDLYFQVNCDLSVEIAKKAVAEQVGQFIFLSSILVYGNCNTAITLETPTKPVDFYGESKLKAEQELKKVTKGKTKLCIIRPPMVYGNGCKGNFPKLGKLAKIAPVFPDYPNRRSIIYIENLCHCFSENIDSVYGGMILPQNSEYMNTTALVELISQCYNRKIIKIKLFNILIRFLVKHNNTFYKLFGDLYYEDNSCNKYNAVTLNDSINCIFSKQGLM